MKSLEELAAIRDKMRSTVTTREGSEGNIRIVVGMATCGIAAGARPILATFTDEIARRNIHNVVIAQTGCIGICQYEPVVEIFTSENEKTTYVNVTKEKALKIVSDHIVSGNPVIEYTIGAVR